MIRGVPYDHQLEYIESTGSQYIDTGVLATQVFGCKLSVEDVATTVYNCFIQNVTTDDFCIGSVNGNTQSSYIRIRSSLTWSNNIGSSKTFSIFGGVINANGAQMGTYDSTLPLGANANSIGLFGGSNGARLSKCRIYSCKLYDSNGVLVRDYIPVSVNGVAKMYDRVTGTFPKHHGTFVAGPVASTPLMGVHFYQKPNLWIWPTRYIVSQSANPNLVWSPVLNVVYNGVAGNGYATTRDYNPFEDGPFSIKSEYSGGYCAAVFMILPGGSYKLEATINARSSIGIMLYDRVDSGWRFNSYPASTGFVDPGRKSLNFTIPDGKMFALHFNRGGNGLTVTVTDIKITEASQS